MNDSAQFGWAAPKFKEQFPNLTDKEASRFDDFNKSIIMLSVNGIITESERDRAIGRATKMLTSVLRNMKA